MFERSGFPILFLLMSRGGAQRFSIRWLVAALAAVIVVAGCASDEAGTLTTLDLTTTSAVITTTTQPPTTTALSSTTTEDPRIAEVEAAYISFVGIFEESVRGTVEGYRRIDAFSSGELHDRLRSRTENRVAEGQQLTGSYEASVQSVQILSDRSAEVIDCGREY